MPKKVKKSKKKMKRIKRKSKPKPKKKPEDIAPTAAAAMPSEPTTNVQPSTPPAM